MNSLAWYYGRLVLLFTVLGALTSVGIVFGFVFGLVATAVVNGGRTLASRCRTWVLLGLSVAYLVACMSVFIAIFVMTGGHFTAITWLGSGSITEAWPVWGVIVLGVVALELFGAMVLSDGDVGDRAIWLIVGTILLMMLVFAPAWAAVSNLAWDGHVDRMGLMILIALNVIWVVQVVMLIGGARVRSSLLRGLIRCCGLGLAAIALWLYVYWHEELKDIDGIRWRTMRKAGWAAIGSAIFFINDDFMRHIGDEIWGDWYAIDDDELGPELLFADSDTED